MATTRKIDPDGGGMHVGLSNITKEQIREYRGDSLEGYADLGLEPDRVYRAYCPAEELSRPETIISFNDRPLLKEHFPYFAVDPPKDLVIGHLGSNAIFEDGYIKDTLYFNDWEGIELVLDEIAEQLSASYFFKPVMEPGEFNGQPYDLVMTNIRCNHVALVERGRAGADVRVADSLQPEKKYGVIKRMGMKFKESFGKKLADILKGRGLASDENAADEAVAILNEAIDKVEEVSDIVDVAEAEGTAIADVVTEDAEVDGDVVAEVTAELLAAFGDLTEINGMPRETWIQNFIERYIARKVDEAVATDETDPEKRVMASDSAKKTRYISALLKPGQKVRHLMASDEAAIEKRVSKRFAERYRLADSLKYLCGAVTDPLAFDSAESMAKYALESAEIPYKGIINDNAIVGYALGHAETLRLRGSAMVFDSVDFKTEEQAMLEEMGKGLDNIKVGGRY